MPSAGTTRHPGTDRCHGATGATGATGAAGTSDVYIDRHAGFSISQDEANHVIASVNVPAGSYQIIGSVDGDNEDDTDDQPIACSLSTGVSSTVRVMERDGTNRSYAQITVIDAATFNADATISLSCSTYRGNADGIVLMATKVTTIH